MSLNDRTPHRLDPAGPVIPAGHRTAFEAFDTAVPLRFAYLRRLACGESHVHCVWLAPRNRKHHVGKSVFSILDPKDGTPTAEFAALDKKAQDNDWSNKAYTKGTRP
jgi:hypothetical protein